ncbi:MAG: dephospho-CoA kinase [Phycisphaerales bacterium]|nr:dephospho-CoA kinase [Phycisphaerales bacterium]
MTTPSPNSDERPVLSLRPSAASIVLRPIRSVVIFIVGFSVLWWYVPPSRERTVGMAVLLALLIARVVWQAVWNACASYELTTLRVRATTGVFSRFGSEIPLARVQNTFVSKSFLERLAGIGTLGIASAGTGGVEIVWSMIDDPDGVLAKVRRELDASERGGKSASGLGDPGSLSPNLKLQPAAPGIRPIVLGLAGGIGAGKSAVARELESRGALVLDSDSRAKSVLETPEARDVLVSWWGPEILKDGRVDRKRVADVVFADAEQRRRLEAFVHPRLHAARRVDIDAAAARGVRLVVIDAPLLQEAGVDKECDAVVFVDAPRQQRLERVRSRGWDDAELTRREAAQLSLSEKKARSTFVIENNGDLAALGVRVGELLREVEKMHGGKPARS